MALKTESLRIARSGPTVDGRTMKPEWLIQAAKNYNRETFTAVIWPEHDRYFNLGLVDSVSVEKNSEGGVDLFAVLEPNEYYRINNSNGQRLFTSVEILENFAKTGEAYLVGLGATDSPASLGNEPVKFNQKAGIAATTFIEATIKEVDEPPNWFNKLFKSQQETDMTKEEMATLLDAQAKAIALSVSTALAENFKSQSPDKPVDKPLTADKVVELFKQLKDNHGELPVADDAPLTVAQFKKLAAEMLKPDEPATKKFSTEEMAALKTQIDELTAKFNKATQEVKGTDGGDDKGAEAAFKDCL
jgi:hypothetical protein